MAFLDSASAVYKDILYVIAEFTVHTLELIGILIIIIGSVKTLIRVLRRINTVSAPSIIIILGRALALALEFKMGAEIVNTVIIHDLKELGILAIVIALRTVLALLIHWEIKSERRDEQEENAQQNENK